MNTSKATYFPVTPWDHAKRDLALAMIAVWSGIPSNTHLSTMLLSFTPDQMRRLLSKKGQAHRYDKLMNANPAFIMPPGQSLDWNGLVDHLEILEAVSITDPNSECHLFPGRTFHQITRTHSNKTTLELAKLALNAYAVFRKETDFGKSNSHSYQSQTGFGKNISHSYQSQTDDFDESDSHQADWTQFDTRLRFNQLVYQFHRIDHLLNQVAGPDPAFAGVPGLNTPRHPNLTFEDQIPHLRLCLRVIKQNLCFLMQHRLDALVQSNVLVGDALQVLRDAVRDGRIELKTLRALGAEFTAAADSCPVCHDPPGQCGHSRSRHNFFTRCGEGQVGVGCNRFLQRQEWVQKNSDKTPLCPNCRREV